MIIGLPAIAFRQQTLPEFFLKNQFILSGTVNSAPLYQMLTYGKQCSSTGATVMGLGATRSGYRRALLGHSRELLRFTGARE